MPHRMSHGAGRDSHRMWIEPHVETTSVGQTIRAFRYEEDAPV